MVSKFCSYLFCTITSSSFCLALRRSQVLPKADLLHATRSAQHFLIFLNNFIRLPEVCAWVHDSRILTSHSGWDTHFSLNLCILCHRRLVREIDGFVFNRIISWSEYKAIKWLSLATEYNSDHSRDAQALSNLSSTKVSPLRLFRHVYRYPL